jgi:hypothetical protein
MSVKRNPNLGPSQMRAKKRRLFLIRFIIVSFFVLIFLFSLAIFSGHQKIKVQTITLSGNAAVPNDEILSIVNRDMAGRYWHLFSRSNSLIFPRFKIKKDILNEIKTINSVNISWQNWQEISIKFSERKPHSVWCGDILPDFVVIKEEECFFADKDGYIFSQAPIFSGSLFIKNYGSLTPNQNNPIGSYFLTKERYSQIYNLIKILESNNLSVVSVFFTGSDFNFKLKNGPVIIFNTKNDLGSSFENLFTAIKSGDLNLEGEANIINYIDLRFENKVLVGKKEI